MSVDPFSHLLTDPAAGHGEPSYHGLFIFPLQGDDGKTRHVLAEMHQVYDGGMREFTSPLTGECIGCCGCNYANERVRHIPGDLEGGIRTTLDSLPRGD